MKILHLSDTHGQHYKIPSLPKADVLVHSGDFTISGAENEAIDFLNWFCDQPYAYKIFISGNHDECLYRSHIEGLDPNVYYLCNSGVEVKGIKFYGVPMFMYDCLTEQQSRNYTKIPSDTNVLITHSPPFGILDCDEGINYGSHELLAQLSSLNLKAHLFGHIHSQQGRININGTVFSNGSPSDLESNIFRQLEVIEI